jgi:hypothetical protein
MKSILIFIFLFTGIFSQLSAQDTAADADTTYWTNGIGIALNFNQASFSDNWKAGGVNSIAFGGLVGAKFSYLKYKTSWDNEIEFQYGMVNNEGQSTRKSADRIFLDSKVGYALSSKWNLYGSINFLTQFTEGYQFGKDATGAETRTLISNFMSPGFLTASLGLEYKPVKYFYMRMSPFSPRLTFVTDNNILNNPETSNYGVEVGDNIRTEWLAFQFLADLNKDVAENLNIKLRYLAFANYENFNGSNIDHRLDAIVTASINKYINTSLTVNLLYDSDQDDDIQFAQALALGFQYKLGARK